MAITSKKFGKSPKGEEITLFTITNKNNVTATVMDFGAILVNLLVPDKNGEVKDLVLGFDNVEDYFENSGCFGSTIGRNSNRIANSEFGINGITYRLDKNESHNNLHSGFDGYHLRMWSAGVQGGNAVKFSLMSPDLDQGFPGNFEVSVTYTLTDDNEVKIHYEGISDKDTVANLTNHSYFNLAGHNSGSVLDHTLWLNASRYTPISAGGIPTGEIANVKGTPMDFTEAKVIGDAIDADFEQLKLTAGYDHNYVIDREDDSVILVARLADNKSGRIMEIYTDCVGIQFYAGNFINTDKKVCKDNAVYKKRDAVALETQFFPNAVNEKNFPSCILKAKEKYDTTTIYKFIW